MLNALSKEPRDVLDVGQSDEDLIQATQQDRAAFVLLYQRYVNKIYRYLYSHTGHQADAEDITSQTFIAALTGLHRYQEQNTFAAWLFTIARRRLADHYRRQKSEQPLSAAKNQADTEPSPLSHVVHNEDLTQLLMLVTCLDEEKQELLRLRFAADLTYAEIGKLTGRSEAATKMAVRRLLAKLEQEWEDHDASAKN